MGEGPFVCEWSGPEAEALREAGSEYGAKTGRPRRVGPIDLVATVSYTHLSPRRSFCMTLE